MKTVSDSGRKTRKSRSRFLNLTWNCSAESDRSRLAIAQLDAIAQSFYLTS